MFNLVLEKNIHVNVLGAPIHRVTNFFQVPVNCVFTITTSSSKGHPSRCTVLRPPRDIRFVSPHAANRRMPNRRPLSCCHHPGHPSNLPTSCSSAAPAAPLLRAPKLVNSRTLLSEALPLPAFPRLASLAAGSMSSPRCFIEIG